MTRNKAGFTLVEIALAILVVAIGVLAIFALLSSGLDNSVRAIDDTHAAMFADNVFNGLRATSVSLAEKQNQLVKPQPVLGSTNCPWETFWDAFGNPATILPHTNITVAAGDVWSKVGNVPITIRASANASDIVKVTFTNVSLRGTTLGIVDHGLRYNLAVASKYPSGAPYAPSFGAPYLWTNVARVTLKVWPGQFGQTRAEDALVFYSEFANPGDL
jgi:Tfp pilus assembly protein PilV